MGIVYFLCECTVCVYFMNLDVKWFSSNPQSLGYGPNAVPAPIEYIVEILGTNITTDTMFTADSNVTFNLPAISSDVLAVLRAQNVFGIQSPGVSVESGIGKFIVYNKISLNDQSVNETPQYMVIPKVAVVYLIT